ncbi:hypothetical protein KDM41_01455 [bacterium]|nr:hypothetical protein [bacterium]
MSRALDHFMSGLVDYAGLFPPAALDVPTAVAAYAAHRREDAAWMLGRFIAPAGRLAEVGHAAAAALGAGESWEFSALVGARDDAAAALGAVAAQAEAIAAFEADHDDRLLVTCLEAPVPRDAGAGFAAEFAAVLADEGLGGRELFLEVLPGDDDEAALAAIATAAATSDDFERIGAKLRCGGVTADAFPSCERIAAVIGSCARLALPLKATAGLHHPVRHRAAEPDVMMHGFLNVFGAGLLAWSGATDAAGLLACVAETEAAAFAFDDEAFAWRERRVAAADVARLRGRALCGFGSCSFAEPRDDLRTLGLLA